MKILCKIFVSLSILLIWGGSSAFAQEINLLPKYGGYPKNEMQKAADEKFLAGIDQHYKGDRKKAAQDIASRGWEYLRQGKAPDAMRRFNQAWLVDESNGSALWGMAVILANLRRYDDSLKLFSEANRSIGEDIDFLSDYARTLGIAGAQAKNETMLKEALKRFARVNEKAPQHTMNLQNWAITLFYVGNFSEAWQKIKLAEATPRHTEIDPMFLEALQRKMPRPR